MKRPLALLLALCWSTPVFSADLASARILVEQKRYDDAIIEFNTLLQASPANADLLIEAARVNAWADRHPQSAALYQQVIVVAPQRRADVVLPLAWQLAWNNQHQEAIPLFREATMLNEAQKNEALHGLAESLAVTNQLPEALATYQTLSQQAADPKARKGEARMLLWLERYDEAIARYQDILKTQPNDKDAQLSLARALNRSGRNLAAVSAYQTATQNNTALDTDTRVERARALRWAGLEDIALQSLGETTGQEAIDLRTRLKQETASHLRGELESSRDSDKLRINAFTLGWQQRFSQADILDVSVRTAQIEQGATDIQGRQLLARIGTRLGNTDAGLHWPALTLGVRDYDGWQTAAWKLQSKWIPKDFWRVDMEAGNETVETVTALNNRVTLNYVAASADWRFMPQWSATLGGAVLRFDDDNQRTRLIGRVERIVLRNQPRLTLGIEGMGFNDSNPTIYRGYYNPARYREIKVFARAEHEAAGWLLGAKLALGALSETPGTHSGLYAWELSATRDLAPKLQIHLYAGGSDSSALSRTGSGYTRDFIGASLIWFY
jgi:tetratricopeptide (TPR) repeat protein